METSNRPDGTMILIAGVSRSGKSVFLKRIIEKHRRAIAWDPKAEYQSQLGFTAYHDRHSFLEAIKAAGDGAATIAYTSNNAKDYDFFCDCAFNFNRTAQAAVVCEELGVVTSSGKAAGHWNRLVNQSLAYGPLLVGTIQRGQEVDKTIMNNCSFIHIARHNTDSDAMYMAAKLGIDISVIPREPLKFVQWSSDKGVICEGSIDFKGAKSKVWGEGSPRFLINNKPQKVGSDGRFDGFTYR